MLQRETTAGSSLNVRACYRSSSLRINSLSRTGYCRGSASPLSVYRPFLTAERIAQLMENRRDRNTNSTHRVHQHAALVRTDRLQHGQQPVVRLFLPYFQQVVPLGGRKRTMIKLKLTCNSGRLSRFTHAQNVLIFGCTLVLNDRLQVRQIVPYFQNLLHLLLILGDYYIRSTVLRVILAHLRGIRSVNPRG